MSSLKYGLNVPKKSQPAAPRNPLFGDDEEEILRPPTDSSRLKKPISQFGNLAGKPKSSKSGPKVEELDPTIYDYDAAYDAMHAKSAAKIAAEKEDAALRKPRYMTGLIAAAEVRERDQLRAKDKLLQKEREAEGDDFADKEKFVTGAYKEQQAQMRKAEEEEKIKEEAEAKKQQGKGMSGFYRSIMEQDEKRHQETMAAAEKAQRDGITIDEGPKEKTETELAKELNEKGARVVLNEDGQLVDKRQLLSAGLNITARPTSTAKASASTQTTKTPLYQGRISQQKAVRERQSKMIEEQLEQATKRAADDEAEEQRKREHAAKSRKTKEDINAVRERFLQRKKEMTAARKEA
ncbi:hypothetical protein EJ05DRAFT_42327 [Pseudovirgaria hyperparasitica]|uniref:Nuclear speckle splicing regulatory protein 1 N-terminal domain-containing protein n=1 Tax=Pseudovirgaria hyperparasitica TaxID=470096 RepID=A0A6A6WMT2_9PEZI|nr:uncharacterized protein EJ05DRAFT_42327 [Pseudovirgaria hyperparasitica]KAF2763530.1 hypothetical protein EJ05DRAFT_42327 [Pseudovirgaria hyperparasitica]